jgi:hypothetical protein
MRTVRCNSTFLHLPPHFIYVFRVILYSEEPLTFCTARVHLASASILNLFTFILPNKTGRRFHEICLTWFDNSQFQTAFSTRNFLHAIVPTNDEADVVCFALIILKWIFPMRWEHSNEAYKST